MDPEGRRRLMRFTRRQTAEFAIVAAVCVGLFLGGNRSPWLLGLVIVAVIVIVGDSWLLRRFR
jgi:hypothetical protein